MPAIFETRPGVVLVIPDASIKGLVTLEGWDGVRQTKSIITDVALDRAENFQEQQSLSDLVYMLSFGERVGPLTLTGLSFAALCGDAAGDATGVERLNTYYNNNRIGNPARRKPLTVVLGSGTDAGTFRAFLVAIRVNVSRPETRLADFTLSLRSLPGGS